MVFCPECGEAAIRRRHPIHEHWRAFLRLKTSLIAMILQLGAAAFFLPMVIATCIELGHEVPRSNFEDYDARDGLLVGTFVALLAIAAGAWFTAGLHHWRRWVPWLVFTAPSAIILSIDTVIAPAVVREAVRRGYTIETMPYQWDQFLMRMAALAGIMLVAAAGIPLGHVMLALERRFRSWCWRLRRRRFRARRFAG